MKNGFPLLVYGCIDGRTGLQHWPKTASKVFVLSENINYSINSSDFILSDHIFLICYPIWIKYLFFPLLSILGDKQCKLASSYFLCHSELVFCLFSVQGNKNYDTKNIKYLI